MSPFYLSLIHKALRILVALIFLQTLYFKFSGAPESVFIFSSLGVEPWGRFAAGFIELLVCVLFVFPGTVWLGAFMGLGTMFGAMISHIFILGIEVEKDGGLLFSLATFCFIGSAILLVWERQKVFSLINMLLRKGNK
ncbi:MAG: DoxX family protein, partial [Leptospira sp.]|nr:DoxX family protein [Leptospira sp.]